MKHSLQRRLLYGFMLVVVITLIGVSVGVSLIIKEQMLRSKQQELLSKGQELALVVGSLQLDNGAVEQLTEFLSSVDSFIDSRVWVVNDSREVIAMSMPRSGMAGMLPGPVKQGMMQRPMTGMMGGNGVMLQQGGMHAIIREIDPVFEGRVWCRQSVKMTATFNFFLAQSGGMPSY